MVSLGNTCRFRRTDHTTFTMAIRASDDSHTQAALYHLNDATVAIDHPNERSDDASECPNTSLFHTANKNTHFSVGNDLRSVTLTTSQPSQLEIQADISTFSFCEDCFYCPECSNTSDCESCCDVENCFDIFDCNECTGAIATTMNSYTPTNEEWAVFVDFAATGNEEAASTITNEEASSGMRNECDALLNENFAQIEHHLQDLQNVGYLFDDATYDRPETIDLQLYGEPQPLDCSAYTHDRGVVSQVDIFYGDLSHLTARVLDVMPVITAADDFGAPTRIINTQTFNSQYDPINMAPFAHPAQASSAIYNPGSVLPIDYASLPMVPLSHASAFQGALYNNGQSHDTVPANNPEPVQRPLRSAPTAPAAKKCNLCNKEFKDASALSKHRKTHKEAQVPCFYCKQAGVEKSFRRADHLKRHVRKRTGKKVTCTALQEGRVKVAWVDAGDTVDDGYYEIPACFKARLREELGGRHGQNGRGKRANAHYQ